MSRKNITLNDKKIRKSAFYKNKNKYNIEDIDVSNILFFNKESYGNKKLLK